jgi:hypothetical protein
MLEGGLGWGEGVMSRLGGDVAASMKGSLFDVAGGCDRES